MTTYAIYATNCQDVVRDWGKFEALLVKAGLQVWVHPTLPDGCVMVEDPRDFLADHVKGYARIDMLVRRANKLIELCRKENGNGSK